MSTPTNTAPEPGTLSWRTSSYSGGNGDCVEVAALPTGRAVRDSKHRDGGRVDLSQPAWQAFRTHVDQHGV